MSATLTCEPGDVWTLRIQGILTKSDLESYQGQVGRVADDTGEALKALIILDGFEGWKTDDDWSDIGFFQQHGNDFTKIGFVGDPKWESEALIFVGAGIRKTEVRYFPTERETDAWAWVMD